MQGRASKNSDNRQQEISEISRSLKALARELDVPVIALSQLSRSVESRQIKKPMLSDLRESGSLEQDADIVMFLYREDYYDKDTENKNITEIIVAKHRNGPVDSVQLFFQKEYTKFRDLLMQWLPVLVRGLFVAGGAAGMVFMLCLDCWLKIIFAFYITGSV